eukprot:TRINITY_DN4087_c0_g1_i8.p2 TRINITY_DN4087_c0_g1~~TRINITY_DN4087_c0_g1_i8.p2  ORF type:complete len:100 (-),score=0.42 TRINITY_DN4087_c0_g1_i8:97-396(-)
MIRGFRSAMLLTYSQTLNGQDGRACFSMKPPCESQPLVGHGWQAALAMRDEPNAVLKRRTGRSSDPIKGVVTYRQQDGGHGSRNPLRNVQQLTCRMDQP